MTTDAIRSAIIDELVEQEIARRAALAVEAARQAEADAHSAEDTARLKATLAARALAQREAAADHDVARITHEVRRTLHDNVNLPAGAVLAQYQAACQHVVAGNGATCMRASDVQDITSVEDLERVKPFLLSYVCRPHRPDARPIGWLRRASDGLVIAYTDARVYAAYAKSTGYDECDADGHLLDLA